MDNDARASAEAALSAAWEQDTGGSSPDPAPAQPEQAQPAPTNVASEGQTERATDPGQPDGLFYDVDPNQLTPEMRQMFDGMQKAFTQRMQSAAPMAKAVETYGGPEQVEAALEFVQSLRDPEALVELRDEISEYLQTQGFSQNDANAAATQAAQEVSQSNESPQDDSFGFEDDTARELRTELDDLRAWREQMEEDRATAAAEVALQRAEGAIREQHPEYTDEDIHSIYERAYAFGGDLTSAAGSFESDRQRILTAYAAAKEQVPSSVGPVSPGGYGQEGEKLTFDEAHKYAKSIAAGLINEDGGFGS